MTRSNNNPGDQGYFGFDDIPKLKHVGEGILQPKLSGDVGYDLVCSEEVKLGSKTAEALLDPEAPSFASIPTGVHVEFPPGIWGMILPRSSSNTSGLLVLPGVIDNGYRGELFALVHNLTPKIRYVAKGTRIAQLVLFPSLVFPLERVEVLTESERGHNGFGSTGD